MANFRTGIFALSFVTILASTNICAMDPSRHHPDYLNFWLALEKKNFELAQNILNSGAVTIDTVNCNGETPLIEATLSGNSDIVSFLIAQPNINLEAIHPHTQQTAIEIAAEAGLSDIVQMLNDFGVSPAAINFKKLFDGFKQEAILEHAMYPGDMHVGRDGKRVHYNNYNNSSDNNNNNNGNAHFHHKKRGVKRGATYVGKSESALTKRRRYLDPEEQSEYGQQAYGAQPDCANGLAPYHHDYYAPYEDGLSQDNGSQEDKENMPPLVDGFRYSQQLFEQQNLTRNGAQSPLLRGGVAFSDNDDQGVVCSDDDDSENSYEQPLSEQHAQFLAQPEVFMCPSCTYVNEPATEYCMACGRSAFNQQLG